MSNTEQMVSVPLSALEKCLRDAWLIRFTCDKHVLHLQDLLAQPAAQHQGEPVAWLVTGQGCIKGAFTNNPSGWAHGYTVTPLYTRPDAGEVERLRDQLLELAKTIHKRHYAKSAPDFEPFDFSSGLIGQIDNMVAGMLQDLSTLRAQLAEAKALLRGIHDGAISGFERYSKIEDFLSARAEPKSCGACSNGCINGCQLEKDSPEYPRIHFVRAHKHTCANVQPGSTSADICDCGAVVDGSSVQAEPSAPAELDERAEFDAWTVRKGRVVGYLGWREDFVIWKARAALERKP